MKAGRFRINLQQFNIREAFAEVMSIQKEQCRAKGIELSISYVNISENVNARQGNGEREMFSPIIKSDESRI